MYEHLESWRYSVENIIDENDENDAFNSATNYDDSVHDESDFEWERLSEFSSSDSETDSEDSDWDPWLLCFISILIHTIGRGKFRQYYVLFVYVIRQK